MVLAWIFLLIYVAVGVTLNQLIHEAEDNSTQIKLASLFFNLIDLVIFPLGSYFVWGFAIAISIVVSSILQVDKLERGFRTGNGWLMIPAMLFMVALDLAAFGFFQWLAS